MSRRWAGWAFLAWGVATVAAGVPARADWAQALFSESAHDFGTVPRGAKVRHNFVLTNRLNEPVTILDVRASCGCTSGSASATAVEPGKAARVEAVMDTRNFVGYKATQLIITLVTATGSQAEVRLGVASTILSDIVLNPGSVDFGPVNKGQAPSSVLTIDRVGAPNWQALRMVSTSKAFTAKLQETRRDAQGVSYQLSVTLKADAAPGLIRDEIRILTNDPEAKIIPVPVTAEVRGELTATPAVLSLGRVASAAGVQGKFLVRGSRPFAIRTIEGAGDGFSVAADDAKAKPLHVVTVSYRPDQGTTRGDLRRTFKVNTDLAGEPPVELNATLHIDP